MDFVINTSAKKLRKSNLSHKDNKKKWYKASSLVNLLAAYASPDGQVLEKFKPAFFLKVTGMSQNTYYKTLKEAEELGFLKRERANGFEPIKIKITAPWLSYYVQYDPVIYLEEPDDNPEERLPEYPVNWLVDRLPNFVKPPFTKFWYTKFCDSKCILRIEMNIKNVQGGPSLDSEAPPATESPTGKPVEELKDLQQDITGNKNTENKERGITNTEYSYTGKYPHAWTAATREEYFWKEEIYEMVMKDNKPRKAVERGAAACSTCSVDEFVHELLDGWYKNGIRIHPSLRGVDKLVEKHAEFMEGPWKGIAKAAPDTELYEIASKIVNYTKVAWPWFGTNPYGVKLEDAEETEAEAIVRILRAKRATPAQVRSLVALITFSQDRSFGHFQDYAQEKIYDREMLGFAETGLAYAREFAAKSSRHKAKAKELASLLEGLGAYTLKL